MYRIDGSGTSLPDSAEVRLHFGCSGVQKPGCGYPTTHLLLLTGPGGAAMEAICSPLRTGDMTHASKTHAQLRPGDLLLGDSQFGGWGPAPGRGAGSRELRRCAGVPAFWE